MARRSLMRLYRGALLAGALIPIPAFAAGGDLPSLVRDIGYCILLAGLLAVVFTRLKIPEIAAFLLAGVIVGPIGAGLVTDPANIDTISQLGLVLLLFVIGLEIDIRKLLGSGRVLIVTGVLQYPLCVAFGVVLTKAMVWLGIGGELLAANSYAPLYVGFAMAASSTLLVVKLFQQTFQLDTEAGRVSLGILIFQDVWAIIVIALQPNLAEPKIVPILLSFLGIGIVVLVAALLARYLTPVIFRWIAKMPEIILVVAVSWCFLIVFLGANLDTFTRSLFGFDLHLGVGAGMCALIAGASIASLPYAMEIIGKVGIVKDFFVTLFFVGLGMAIPRPESMDVLVLAVVFSVLALLARYLVFLPLLYFSGLDRRNAMVASTRLAQVSEFTLVIAFLGLQLGHVSDGLNSAIIFAFVITALITPSLYKQADALHDRLGPLLERCGFRTPTMHAQNERETYALALLGFHRVASSLLYELGLSHPELLAHTLVVDFNVNIHPRIAALGPTVKYGDLQNTATLHHAGVDRARVIVCTIPDDVLKGTTNRQIVEAARQVAPDAVIIANAIELTGSAKLYEAGADYVFVPRVSSAKAAEEAVIHALNGEIASYRDSVAAAEGEWHERHEVFP